MPETSTPDTSTPATFEEALRRLEALVAQLEADDADLESALKAYEEGVALARRCQERLEAAELRVQELALE